MAIPDYQTVMLPLLKHLGDKRERGNQETVDELAREFDLNEDELREVMASGRQPVFVNKVAWAKVYLKKAGLLESPRRGFYRITERGIGVLKDNPSRIDTRFLMRFPEFVAFRKPGQSIEQEEPPEREDLTPEDSMEYGYKRIRQELADELLKRIKESTPGFFESIVVGLLLKMGYGGSVEDAGKAIGRSGDEGIDGIIKEDKLGLDTLYIQAKRWDGAVGRPEIQKFVGALHGQQANKGVFITTSTFSEQAQEYVRKIDVKKVILIDGAQLAQLMIDHDIGVSKVVSYDIKKIDLDYFMSE
jgi:restriction system protein